MKLAETLLRELKHRGIKTIFGVPGRENASILFNEVPGINYMTTRVEYTAGMMAAQLGRLTGIPQVAFCTMGPGATNMATPIAAAMLNRSPMILISAQVESSDRLYNKSHQCVDQRAVFEPITKWSYELNHPSELRWVIDKAFRIAAADAPGPVHISIPTDFYLADLDEYDIETPATRRSTAQAPIDDVALRAVREALVDAKNPLCIIGDEVSRSDVEKQVVQFCEEWGLPAITAANVNGIFDASNRLNLGSASPYMEGIIGAHDTLDRLFSNIDVVVCIGVQYVDDLLPKMWTRGIQKQVLSISTQPQLEVRKQFPIDIESVGSLELQFEFLNSTGGKRGDETEHDFSWLRQIYERREQRSLEVDRLDPVSVLSVLNERLAIGGALITDIGFYRHHAKLFAKPASLGRFFTETALSSFGVGLSAALATQLHFADEEVFLIAGDGGFHSTSSDLATAARYDLPIVIVILNSQSYELIGRYQEKGGNGSNRPIVDLENIDFVKLAEANNCVGVRTASRTELRELIASRDRNRPLVIEVPCEYKTFESFYESF